jgi:hypothetical protein
MLVLLERLLLLGCRLKSAADALAAALELNDRRQALVMLGADISLLDTPALRVRQRLDVLSELLQVSGLHYRLVLSISEVCLVLYLADISLLDTSAHRNMRRLKALSELLQVSRLHYMLSSMQSCGDAWC